MAIGVPLTACGAGGANGGPSNACATAGTPGIDSRSVTLGLLTPGSGPIAQVYLPFRAGVDARIGVENARGGIGGRTISYKWESDDSADTGGTAGIRRLVDDHVFGVLIGSSNLGTGADYLESQNVPAVGAATDDSWRGHPNIVSFSYSSGLPVSTFGDVVRSHGGTKVAYLSLALVTASEHYGDIIAAGLRSSGIATADSVRVPVSGAVAYDQIAETLRAEHVDTLISGLAAPQLAQLVTAMHASGQRPLVISVLGGDDTTLRGPGPQLAGTYFLSQTRPFESAVPALNEYTQGIAAYAPYLPTPRYQVAMYGWDSADLFIQGLHRAGDCPTRASFLAGIRSLRDYDADQLLPQKVDFSVPQRTIAPCYFISQIAPDGRSFVPGNPLVQCGQGFGG